MLEIKIRHEISETSEEVYEFVYDGHTILYKGIWFSNRDSKDDIWGYDYYDYLLNKHSSEVEQLDNMYDSDEISYEDFREKIDVIFAPKDTRTIHGKVRSIGFFGSHHEYPPKIEPTKLREIIIKNITDMLEKTELKL